MEPLVEPHSEILLEQARQTHPRLVQQLGGDPGIEHAGGAETVFAIQQSQIVVRVMEHDLDVWISQHLAQRT